MEAHTDPRVHVCTWEQINSAVTALCERNEPSDVYGVPRGGCTPAALVAAKWGTNVLDRPAPDCLVVDDLIDSGATRDRFASYQFDALYRKPHSPWANESLTQSFTIDAWLVFPWEANETGPEDAVVRLLQHIGEDPERHGLLDTPSRVTRALTEMTSGYRLDPGLILSKQFEQDEHYGGIIILRDIPFASLCEHHMLPFTGTATVAYIPGDSGKIVGLSKLARLVDCYARRLQVQERLTVQIVEALQQHLQPAAAAAIITADHTCMSIRGASKNTGGMVTSELRGLFFADARARTELMELTRA